MKVKQAMVSCPSTLPHHLNWPIFQQANGTAEDCFSLRCLQNTKNPDPRPDHLSKEEEIIKETVGTMYEGTSLTEPKSDIPPVFI